MSDVDVLQMLPEDQPQERVHGLEIPTCHLVYTIC
jgi:hypothetical protein